MTAAARRTPGNRGMGWTAPMVLLAAVWLCMAFVAHQFTAAGDPQSPTPEAVARYLDAYNHEHATGAAAVANAATNGDDGAQLRNLSEQESAAPGAPTPTYETLPPLTPEEVAKFDEWYHHDQVGRSSDGTVHTPTADDVARFRQWYNHQRAAASIALVSAIEPAPVKDNAAQFLEAYRRRNVATATAAPTAPEVTAEAVERFVEWYRHECAPRSADAAEPSPSPQDVARFLAWYQRHGAPTPAAAPAEPAPSEREVACYLEAYRHSGAPTPHAAPVVTRLDVQPISDGNVCPVVAPGPPLRLPPVASVPVEQGPQLNPTPPAAPLTETPRLTHPVAASPPASSSPAPPPPPAVEPPYVSPFDAILQQAGCSSCGTGGGLLGQHAAMDGPVGPTVAGPDCNCGCGGECIPGRLHGCSACEADTVIGRFLCGVYECICCPDPCYDPHWIPLADAAFFVESARPQTQQRVGWDAGHNLTGPDAGEYFWARADGRGRGPNPGNHANPNGLLGERRVNYNDLYMYTEAALGNIGTYVYMPYRSLEGDLVGHAAGFGDVQVGTKTLLFDCELLQIALGFRTYIPSGNAGKGLGTGHVSLEPSLIVGVKVAPETYFQGQLAEWIPLGGDPDYEGAILNYRMSLNQVLYRILPDVPLVGTAEFIGYSFQHGHFTDPVTGETRITGTTYISMGPGLRVFVCDKIDFGVGMAFSVTERHFAEELFRSEFRWRF